MNEFARDHSGQYPVQDSGNIGPAMEQFDWTQMKIETHTCGPLPILRVNIAIFGRVHVPTDSVFD